MAIVGDFFDFQNGYAFKSSDFVKNASYKVIKIKELKNGEIVFSNDSVSIEESKVNDKKYIVQKGDVLFALTGDPVCKNNPLSWVGRVSYYNHEFPSLINQRVCKVIPKLGLSPQYLYYFFRQFSEFYSLASKATGSASQANISTKTISEHIINICDIKMANKIADFLSQLDKKISLNNSINKNLYI